MIQTLSRHVWRQSSSHESNPTLAQWTAGLLERAVVVAAGAAVQVSAALLILITVGFPGVERLDSGGR